METYSVSLDIMEEVPVLVIEGDMTSESDSDVMKPYNEIKKAPAPKNIIINFEKTKYINSAGIASLINIIQDLQESGGKISFVGLTNHFRKVMDIVGISDFVEIFDLNKEALESIKRK